MTTSNGAIRESWLLSAIELLRPDFAAVKLTLPSSIYVSVGFPSTRALSRKQPRIGECWHASASPNGCPQVFISPLIADGLGALACLVHELVHACGISGHRADFKKPATALGLEGKMRESTASRKLLERLNVAISELGPYPHAGLNVSQRPTTKQTTRLLKAVCEECEAIIRLTAKVVDDPGLPTCACGGEFQLDL